MKKMYGTVASRDGSYVRVAISKTTKGFKFSGTKIWDTSQSHKNHFFLNKGTHLGVESHWVRMMPDENDLFTFASGTLFTPCTQSAHLQVHIDALENNLLGTYPDDIFLCTLPLYLQDSPPSSFVSLFQEDGCCKIGIVIDRKIAAVFTAPVSTDTQLQSYLGRIERYWANLETKSPFPEIACVFNNQAIDPGDRFSVQHIKTPSLDSTILKAMGVAFCHIEPDLPAFTGPTAQSKLINLRATFRKISYLMISLPVLLFGLLYLLNYLNTASIKQYENEYKNVLANNQEIRELLVSGEAVALKHLRLESAASNPTRWSSLLYVLGMKRPGKLYFERLGSDPVSGQSGKMRIALTGWAEAEMVVTELIKSLNTTEFLTRVTLSSLERDDKQKNYFRFKILCTMNLSQN